ncbi:MAG: peptidoglycan-binding protein [Myxococcaceae bacterium]|jgi:peptidoglycan hydrolase-like protein with peptidoglycan-binding domain|nr:peptidoglycan-binding protein [Myxococcaceae bacterium]
MTNRLTRTDFTRALERKSLDVAQSSTDPALRGLDVAKADLNRDGVVSGAAETSALFTAVDAFDRNGDAHSVARTTAGGAPTRAAAMAAALQAKAVFMVSEPTGSFRDAALRSAFSAPGSLPLSRGAQGDGARAVQYGLARLGFSVGVVDGRFGPGTERGVKAFQASAGLSQTGVVDAATLGALDARLASTDLRTPAERSGDPLRYLAAQAVAGPRLSPIRDRSKPVDWNHPEVQAAYGAFTASYWQTLKENRVEADCKTLSLFMMDQFRAKVGADLGVQLPRPATLPAKEWLAATAARTSGAFSRFETLPTVRPGYENAQAVFRLDPSASMMTGPNVRYAGVDANMASRALALREPWSNTRDNGGDPTKPELPIGQLRAGDVIVIDHTGDGRVDHMANVISAERDAAGRVTSMVLATGSFDDMKDANGATAPNSLGEVNNYAEEVTVRFDEQGRVTSSAVTWSSEPAWLVGGRYSARSLLMELKEGGTIAVGRWAQPAR